MKEVYVGSFPSGHTNLSEVIMIYFECHITIEPVFGEELENLKQLARSFGFRVASLMMQKRTDDTPERSKNDTFMTATNTSYDTLSESMVSCIKSLQVARYKIWRYKIEDIKVDSRFQDVHNLLGA